MAGTAAFVEYGRRGETQEAAEGTDVAILALTKSLRQRNHAQAVWSWMEAIG